MIIRKIGGRSGGGISLPEPKYFEVEITVDVGEFWLGMCLGSTTLPENALYLSGSQNIWSFRNGGGEIFRGGTNGQAGSSGIGDYAAGDTLGFLVWAGHCWLHKNGVWTFSGLPATATNMVGNWRPCCSVAYSGSGGSVTYNFAPADWNYSVPANWTSIGDAAVMQARTNAVITNSGRTVTSSGIGTNNSAKCDTDIAVHGDTPADYSFVLADLT